MGNLERKLYRDSITTCQLLLKKHIAYMALKGLPTLVPTILNVRGQSVRRFILNNDEMSDTGSVCLWFGVSPIETPA